MKKIIAIILAALMVFSMAACGTTKNGPEETPVYTPETDQPVDGPSGEQEPVPVTEPEPEEISLTFTKDEWPVVDGATAFLPFYQEMTARMLGVTTEEAADYLMCSTTDLAYPYLWRGKADIIFCLRPSQEQVTSAMEESNVVFEEVPFANEGFVFFVNKDNPVDDITVEQLRGIYAGKITNWKEVGGNDEEIIAYQRSEGSGSQTGLYLHVISPDEVENPPLEKRISTMGEIIDAVAGYENASGAIGYSYRYFVTNMHYDEQIKMLRVNGVYPEYANIADGSYPLISDVCAVYREDEPEGSAARKIAAWCASSQGAMLAKELGYVPTQEAIGTLYKPETTRPDDVEIDYAKGSPCPECTVMNTYFANNLEEQEIIVEDGERYASYVHISGLKDKAVERKVNDLIEDTFYELYEADVPPYPGAKTRLASFDGYEGCDSYDSIYANVRGSFNNILSVQIYRYINKYYWDEETSDYDEINIQDYRTLNIDLRTGKQIFIGDLFADNIDGIAYINEKIAAESDKPEAFDEPSAYWYDESGSDIHFRRAFEGINRNQKFLINSYDGSLTIVLDYENPEIATLFNPTEYSVSMRGINAYESRFMTSESLFTDETPSPALFGNSFDSINAETVYDYIDDWIPEYHVSLSMDTTIYDDMPESVKQMLRPEGERMDSLENYARARCEYLTKTCGYKGLNCSANFYTYVSRYGDYANVNVTTGFWASDSDWNYLDDSGQTTTAVFAGDSDVPMGLSDIFTPDCDMYQVMEDAVVARVSGLIGEWYGTDTYAAMFREVVTSLDGFNIYSDLIELDCPSINDIIYTYLPAEGDSWELRSCLTELRYRDLGMDNLTIFN